MTDHERSHGSNMPSDMDQEATARRVEQWMREIDEGRGPRGIDDDVLNLLDDYLTLWTDRGLSARDGLLWLFSRTRLLDVPYGQLPATRRPIDALYYGYAEHVLDAARRHLAQRQAVEQFQAQPPMFLTPEEAAQRHRRVASDDRLSGHDDADES